MTTFFMKDLYPNFQGIDTSEEQVPDVDDKAAVGEDTRTAEQANVTESSKRNIFLALLIIVLLVVFFGTIN